MSLLKTLHLDTPKLCAGVNWNWRRKKLITAGSLSDFLGLCQLFQVITIVKPNFKCLDTRTTLTPRGQQFYHQRSSPSKDSALGSRESTPGGVSITSQPRPAPEGQRNSDGCIDDSPLRVVSLSYTQQVEYDLLNIKQGSHSTWKTWKNESTSGNIMEFWKI